MASSTSIAADLPAAKCACVLSVACCAAGLAGGGRHELAVHGSPGVRGGAPGVAVRLGLSAGHPGVGGCYGQRQQ